MILVDSNVAMDALDAASPFHQWAMDELSSRIAEGPFLNLVVVAELAARAIDEAQLVDMLETIGLPVQPMDERTAFRAGQAFKTWIRNGGRRGALLPDFLIGAQAAVLQAAVLTRDPRRFRSYFPEVELLLPEEGRL